MGGGGKRGWGCGVGTQLDALHHPLATLLSPRRPIQATPSSTFTPSHPLVSSSSVCALPAGRHQVGEDTWAGRTGSSHVRQSKIARALCYQGIKTRPPAQFAVFSEGFPLPPQLLIVKMRSLIGGWVKSPVISAGNHPLIERYHKNQPGVWFFWLLLGAPFVPWRSPAHGHTAHFTFSGGD